MSRHTEIHPRERRELPGRRERKPIPLSDFVREHGGNHPSVQHRIIDDVQRDFYDLEDIPAGERGLSRGDWGFILGGITLIALIVNAGMLWILGC